MSVNMNNIPIILDLVSTKGKRTIDMSKDTNIAVSEGILFNFISSKVNFATVPLNTW